MGDFTNSYTIRDLIFSNSILNNVKKKFNSYGFWKINKFIRFEKKDNLVDYKLDNYFFNYL